jgi:hypothetical protein
MSPLDTALRELAKARKRLADGQGRTARRNARLAFFGALRSVKYAAGQQYPVIEKEKPAPEPKPPKKVPKPTLPFRRAWDMRAAKLFLRFVESEFDTIALTWSPRYLGGNPYNVPYSPNDSAANWDAACRTLAGANRVRRDGEKIGLAELYDLYRRFWTEPLPTEDVKLAARHQQMLDKGVNSLPFWDDDAP